MKKIKTFVNLMLLAGIILLGTKAEAQTFDGGATGTNQDIYVVNTDESHHDAVLRLHNKNSSGRYRHWSIFNSRQDQFLYFSLSNISCYAFHTLS